MTSARRRVAVACFFAAAILVACGGSSSNGPGGGGNFPQCTTTQHCVGYPSIGQWACLESCGDAGDCPSGMTCQNVSGCCSGTACSAVSVPVCVASDAGPSGDGAADAPSEASANDGNGGFPQCTATQHCVGYPSIGDWVCLDGCGDAGSCPSGMTCKNVSGCCSGTACSAVSVPVCVASDAGAGGDGASDAPSDGSANDGNGSFPQCTAAQRCVGYPSFGDWVCLESCGDAGDCPSGMTCKSVGGCCSGAACSAPSDRVCVASDAGAGVDGASDASSDASASDGDGGFPQCTGTQRCVGYPSIPDWVCLDPCGDGGSCPSGMTCKTVSGCCTGGGCAAIQVAVCAP